MAETSTPKKILVTGGCGRIGSYFIASTADRYTFRMVDRIPWDTAKHGPFPGEALVADLSDLDACRRACQGMDAVVHLAGNPNPSATFEALLPDNFITTYNMFTAAQEAGCRRLIFASSIHAVFAYPREVVVTPDMPIWPEGLYGVSKCFGEAVGIVFAYQRGLSNIALRIGSYWPHGRSEPPTGDVRRSYLNADDLNQLLVKCLETPGIQFAIVHATSNNLFKRLDISATIRNFGYEPQADGYALV
jgi:nucleoside-diphosphate-sugar epimerase